MRGAALLVAALALPAHGAAPAPESSFALAIAAGKVEPAKQVIRVAQGANVVIRITSDVPGEAHLHAYRMAARVGPGRESTWRFVAKASGRFRIEWHAEGESGSHAHGPPLASLEVMPP